MLHVSSIRLFMYRNNSLFKLKAEVMDKLTTVAYMLQDRDENPNVT